MSDLEKRISKARRYMARFRKEPLGHFIITLRHDTPWGPSGLSRHGTRPLCCPRGRSHQL